MTRLLDCPEFGATSRRLTSILLGWPGARTGALGRGLVVLFVQCALAGPATAAAPPGRTIGTISIEIHDVFDTLVPSENNRVFNIANGVHRNTREAVVRRELLFSEGGTYDAALLQETERNLRRLSFIRRADCVAAPDSGAIVNVLVRTYDAWTLQVITSFKRAGGREIWRAGLVDHNLAGEGKDLSARYSHDDSTSAVICAWKDPYFLGRKLDYSMAAVLGPDHRSYSFGLNRPFYASTVRSALGFSGSYAQQHVDTFVGETAVGTARKRTQELGVNYGVALGTSPYRNRHITAGVLHHRVRFDAIPGTPSGPAPNNESLEFLQLGGEWEVLDFIKERHIQKFSHLEDINLGLGVFPGVVWAPHLRSLSSAGSQLLPSVALRKGFRSTARHLVLLHAAYTSIYTDGGNSNRIASMDAAYFLRALPRQTLAFHADYDHGWRLDPARPLTLGESNGLRGYGLRQFAGNRRLLFNSEDRIFIRDELWSLLDVGAVVFYDAGYAWPAGSPLRFADLKNSLGFGLRLAPSRSSSNSPLRIDLAYALRDNQRQSRWSLSILGGHSFGARSD